MARPHCGVPSRWLTIWTSDVWNERVWVHEISHRPSPNGQNASKSCPSATAAKAWRSNAGPVLLSSASREHQHGTRRLSHPPTKASEHNDLAGRPYVRRRTCLADKPLHARQPDHDRPERLTIPLPPRCSPRGQAARLADCSAARTHRGSKHAKSPHTVTAIPRPPRQDPNSRGFVTTRKESSYGQEFLWP